MRSTTWKGEFRTAKGERMHLVEASSPLSACLTVAFTQICVWRLSLRSGARIRNAFKRHSTERVAD
jgi:hypothetical protein